MDGKRWVHRMLTIFDLTDYKDFKLPEGVSTRVMFIYDEKEKVKEFIVVDRKIPAKVNCEITSWLKENMEPCRFIHTLNNKTADAEL
jgi:hypothetical protein